MALVAGDHESPSRKRVIFAFVFQGIAGIVLISWLTYAQFDATAALLRALGPAAPVLVALFFVFSLTLALLKFSLTEMVFVSFSLTAFTVMLPLLGPVLSAWIGVTTSMLSRLLGVLQIAPVKSDLEDPLVDYVKILGQFGTYGIPLAVAGLAYQAMGGQPPSIDVSLSSAARMALTGIILQVTNNFVMVQVEQAYGYSLAKSARLSAIDTGVYSLTLPFAVLMALSYPALGWPGLLGWSFVGVMVNIIWRKLALAQSGSREMINRLTSLAAVGRSISLNVSTSELLMAVYEACKPAVDVSIFTIALVDETRKELSFELLLRDGKGQEGVRIPLGEGLTSWVVRNNKPLLLRSAAEEEKLGLTSVLAGEPTESWVGVPMIARDRVVGAIIIQSYKKNMFTWDDVALLTTIANQAAVALENARLFQDLEALTQDLENRVAARTAELQELNVHLIAADRTKSQFLANMSHELRTPLNSIIGFSSVLLQATRSVLEPRLYKFVENINTAGSYLLTLINDILDLSKIEAGRLQMQLEPLDLRETIMAVERVMRGAAAEMRVTIATSIDGRIPLVELDESRLKQILFNLLSNAVKFSHPDSTVELSAKLVPASESPIGADSIRLSVIDRGIGISPDELPKIFDQFHQTDEGRKFRKQGTGLGLSLTRNFVGLLRGAIDVQSTLGQGSTFTIHLPVRPLASAPVPREALGVHDNTDASRAQ